MKNLGLIFGGVVVLLLGIFVWPTMYRYDKLNMKYPVRINRLTGATQVLYPDGWQPMGNASNSSQTTSNTTTVNKQTDMLNVGTTSVPFGDITINDIQVSGDQITCQLVNNSSHLVTVGEFQAELYDSNGNVLPDQPMPAFALPEPISANQSVPVTFGTLEKEANIGEFKFTLAYGTQS